MQDHREVEKSVPCPLHTSYHKQAASPQADAPAVTVTFVQSETHFVPVKETNGKKKNNKMFSKLSTHSSENYFNSCWFRGVREAKYTMGLLIECSWSLAAVWPARVLAVCWSEESRCVCLRNAKKEDISNCSEKKLLSINLRRVCGSISKLFEGGLPLTCTRLFKGALLCIFKAHSAPPSSCVNFCCYKNALSNIN